MANDRHVMVFPEVRCAYNRIKKAANSSTLMYLGDALAARHSHAAGVEALDYHSHKCESRRKGTSLSRRWFPSDLASHFWFTVVRNPYSRVLSAFLQKGAAAARGSPGFAGIPGFDRLDSRGFANFVGYLERDGLRADSHWTPQVELLFLPVARYDMVARTENLAEDLSRVFLSLGLPAPVPGVFAQPHRAEKDAGWKVTSATSKVAQFYDHATAMRVRQLYDRDFRELGYADELPS
jgi:hypothetical protein